MPSSSTESSPRPSGPLFKPIDYNHNLFGFFAIEGDRAVEVIRVDYENGDWMTFATIDGHVVKKEPGNSRLSKGEAMSWARKFISKKITPETWPNKTEMVIGAKKRW